MGTPQKHEKHREISNPYRHEGSIDLRFPKLRRYTTFTELFSIDYRSLALIRISLGLLILGNLFWRAQDLTAHYTDRGILPRAPFLEKFASPYNFSFHLMTGTKEGIGALMILQALVAFGLTLGYRTRLMTILSWVFMISLQNRNPMILNNGDVLIRVTLFWCLFLPLGTHYSLDRLLEPVPSREPQKALFSSATIAFLMQFVFLYVCVFLHKTGTPWWPDGTAIYYALSIDQLTTHFGHALLQIKPILKPLTFATIAFQVTGPLMLFVPFYTYYFRLFALAGFWTMQLGFYLCFILGTFPFISTIASFGFIPSRAWDMLEKKFKSSLEKSDRWFKTKLSPLQAQLTRKKVRYVPHSFEDLIAAWAFVYVLFWNLDTLPQIKYQMSESTKIPGYVLRLDQQWNMFSPYPMTDDGWYVIPGILNDGTKIDLFHNNQPPTFEKPDVVSLYPNAQWQKYMMNLWNKKYSAYRLYYGRYLCRRHNSGKMKEDPQALKEFDIVYMREDTLADRESTPTPVTIWKHSCWE